MLGWRKAERRAPDTPQVLGHEDVTRRRAPEHRSRGAGRSAGLFKAYSGARPNAGAGVLVQALWWATPGMQAVQQFGRWACRRAQQPPALAYEQGTPLDI